MRIQTLRFGEIEIAAETVITMTQGPFGFEALRRFCLIEHAPGCEFRWLQSLEDPAIAFVVIDPMPFFPDYEVMIEDDDVRELGLESPAQAAVFTIVTIPDDVRDTSANLLGPIVINADERKAKQVILQNDEYMTKHRLLESPALRQPATAEARA
jgi:flagellar assembly factor FliW